MEVHSIEQIVAALNSAHIKYLIVGGLVVNAHGYERLTRGIDLVIGLEPENIIRGLHALLDLSYRMSIPVTPEEFAGKKRREAWRKEKNTFVLKLWRHASTFLFTSLSISLMSSVQRNMRSSSAMFVRPSSRTKLSSR